MRAQQIFALHNKNFVTLRNEANLEKTEVDS